MGNKPAKQDDRRDSIRISKKLSVQFKKGLRAARQAWINTTIRDISESGICIITDSSFRKHSYVRLRFRIPTERLWLEIKGTTIKSDRYGKDYWTHIRLIHPDARQKKRIRTYIAWVLVKEGGTL